MTEMSRRKKQCCTLFSERSLKTKAAEGKLVSDFEHFPRTHPVNSVPLIRNSFLVLICHEETLPSGRAAHIKEI